MKRRIAGLEQVVKDAAVPEGIFLVRVERASYSSSSKPYFSLWFCILEPGELADRTFSGRLYCTEKALWKLHWFLRDFDHDADLLEQETVDEKKLVGLRGIVKISRANFNGRSYVNLDAFAPAWAWKDISTASPEKVPQ